MAEELNDGEVKLRASVRAGYNNNTATPDLGEINPYRAVSGILGAITPAITMYNSIQDADSKISALDAYALQDEASSLSEAKDAILNYNPIKFSKPSDFGYDQQKAELGLLGGVASGGSAFGMNALSGIGAAIGFGAGLIGMHKSHNKAIAESNKYNAAVSDLNKFNYATLDSNLKNIKTQNMYNSIYNSAAFGGFLSTQGSDWSTGLNYIGAGGSHEQNPNGGIQQGIAPDGLPNLVEEGEVIWNGDYVFSKRLKVPKATRNKYKLRGTKPMSFADAALEFNKEMEERPNDPISKRGRDGMLAKLADVQEEKRAKIAAKEQAQQAATMDMMGMPQDQMAMQEQPVQDGIMSEANQEELARQEIMQGMQQPMVEGYAAKGGPIGHKYTDGSWKLTEDYLRWLEGLDDNTYNSLVASVYDPKRNPKRYAKYTDKTNGRKAFFDRANYKSIGNVHKAISSAYNAAYPKSQELVYPTLQDNFLYQPEDNFMTNVDAPLDLPPLNVETGIGKANKRWESRYPGVPLLGPTTNYKPDVKVTNPAANWVGFDDNGNPIDNNGNIISGTINNGVYDYTPIVSIPDTEKGLNLVINKGRESSNEDGPNYPWQGYLRYAPAIGAGLGVFSDLMGWTNKPDYSAADAILRASRGVRNVSFTPIGDYMKYTPFDRMFYLNQLNANAGATRRAIINQSAGNRGTAIAGILAADNNAMNSIGNLARQAEEYNLAQRQKVAEFNRDTNKFNSEGFLKAAMANQGAGEVRAKYAAMAADARQKALAQASAARSANLTNLFDSLGNIGIDALNRADALELAKLWAGADRFASLRNRKHGGRIRKRRRGRVI